MMTLSSVGEQDNRYQFNLLVESLRLAETRPMIRPNSHRAFSLTIQFFTRQGLLGLQAFVKVPAASRDDPIDLGSRTPASVMTS